MWHKTLGRVKEIPGGSKIKNVLRSVLKFLNTVLYSKYDYDVFLVLIVIWQSHQQESLFGPIPYKLTVSKIIDVQRYITKCSGENEILRVIFRVLQYIVFL